MYVAMQVWQYMVPTANLKFIATDKAYVANVGEIVDGHAEVNRRRIKKGLIRWKVS